MDDEDDDDDDDEGESGSTIASSRDQSDASAGSKEISTRQTMRQGGTLIFTRKHGEDKVKTRLQDFTILKLVGKGAFGKVYLV